VSGQEFDVDALVRVFNNTDLGVVRAAIAEAGLSDAPQMGAAVEVLEELDDEIRLLRRYRVTQENSLEGMFSILDSIRIDLLEILTLVAGSVAAIDPNLLKIPGIVTGIIAKVRRANDLSLANAKATRLARAKLDELIETRGKIALILL